MAKAGGGVCRGTRTGERGVSVLRLKGDPGRCIIIVRTRMMMAMVRVGLGRLDGDHQVVGGGVPLHRARHCRGDGHGHRQNGEHHCAKTCQGPYDPVRTWCNRRTDGLDRQRTSTLI